MIKGGVGGANTSRNGLKFEKDTDFSELVDKLPNYKVEEINFNDKKITRDFEVYRDDVLVGKIMSQYRFYDFLSDIGLDNFNSKQWKPDEVFVNFETKTVYIVEKKWQETEGSVDEKLLGFGNKRRLYQRLLDKAEEPYAVQFVFVGNDFFKRPNYRDSFEMLRGDGVKIMLEEYDMTFFGLY
ncbi:PD-(D/E)XK nuclease superfamily protein [Streptococcus oricebi]|uniref:PD-(D/E)XK nuclease domain-containing protein n=1 Tax=Streptococcus oricebi TaxID=1547447 RepID=A0ABS5B5Q6_9STRE|nr:PD-(D/E)XK nuclease superfamily protein [Streptococcus oricebi]MBP2624036.1 hypothetical protein [Streptococcus oricebi]